MNREEFIVQYRHGEDPWTDAYYNPHASMSAARATAEWMRSQDFARVRVIHRVITETVVVTLRERKSDA